MRSHKGKSGARLRDAARFRALRGVTSIAALLTQTTRHMTPSARAVSVAVFSFAVACAQSASAAPDDKPSSTLNRGSSSAIKTWVNKTDFDFCTGPQNPHVSPYAPVKIVMQDCNDMSQTYFTTSPGPTNSTVGCGGGFAIAFGPKHNLNTSFTDITMIAEWADTPLSNSQQCNAAKLAAQAWGARCLDATCEKSEWEAIEGGPKQREGKWENNACTLQVKFSSQGVRYKNLSLDMIAARPEGNQTVRKKAKGTIVAAKKDNTPCYVGEAKPAQAPTKK